jgi:CoA:oxalate CoA-transferase
LFELLAQCTRQRTVDEFLAACRERNVICAPINTMQRVLMDPHLGERRCLVELDQPGIGALRLPGAPTQFSTGGLAPRRPAPRLGEHTAQILQEKLGMTPEEIDALCSRNVIRGTR